LLLLLLLLLLVVLLVLLFTGTRLDLQRQVRLMASSLSGVAASLAMWMASGTSKPPSQQHAAASLQGSTTLLQQQQWGQVVLRQPT
jgi:hypothetical protein